MAANAPIKIPRLKLKVPPKAAAANAAIGVVNKWIDDLCSAIERALKIGSDGQIGITQTPAGTTLRLNLPESFYIKLTSDVGADNGYKWAEVFPYPPVKITAPGTGLTTPVSITINPTSGNGSGATMVGTASSAGNLIGTYNSVQGTAYTTAPGLVIGGGATAVANWPNWSGSSRTSTAADLAYELSGNRCLSPSSTVYKVTRHKANGALIFDGGDKLIPVVIGVSSIATGTYTTPTAGTANLLLNSPTTPGFVLSGSVTIYNPFVQSAPASKFAWCQFRNGNLYLVTWDC